MTQISARGAYRFPISNFILVTTCFISALSHADPLFPDLPSRSLPAIRVLPNQDEIILVMIAKVHGKDTETVINALIKQAKQLPREL